MDKLWQIEFVKKSIDGNPISYIKSMSDDNGTLQDMAPFDEKPVFGNIVDVADECDPYFLSAWRRTCG